MRKKLYGTAKYLNKAVRPAGPGGGHGHPVGRHRKNRDGCSFGAHGGIRAAQKQKKIVWSEIKWVDKVFYNNEVENVKFLKSGRLAFENREDV